MWDSANTHTYQNLGHHTSSPQLITSHFHLPLSHSHLLNSLISSSPQLIIPQIFYLNPMLGFFFSLHVVPIVLFLFESQMCVLSPLVFDWLCWVSCFYLFIYFGFFVLLNIFIFWLDVLRSIGFIIL